MLIRFEQLLEGHSGVGPARGRRRRRPVAGGRERSRCRMMRHVLPQLAAGNRIAATVLASGAGCARGRDRRRSRRAYASDADRRAAGLVGARQPRGLPDLRATDRPYRRRPQLRFQYPSRRAELSGSRLPDSMATSRGARAADHGRSTERRKRNRASTNRERRGRGDKSDT